MDRLEFIRRVGIDRGRFKVRAPSEMERQSYDATAVTTAMITDASLDLASDLTKAAGSVMLFGGTEPSQHWRDIDIDVIRRSEAVVPLRADARFVQLIGTYGIDTADLDESIRLLALPGPSLPVERLVTRIATLEEAPAIMQRLVERSLPGKVLIRISMT
jgi:threonine dehydrogenase-like Zn-dependent dehydrogenase